MRNRHFSLFKTFVDRDRRTALLLNPKVLTNFTRALLTEGYRDFHGRADPSDGRYRLWGNARNFPVARLRDYRHFLRHHDDYDIHAFVRNPYARVLSGWKDKFRDGHMKSPDGRASAYPRSMRGRELRAARRFAAARGLPGAEDGTLFPFPSFVAMIADQQVGHRNQHWDQQVAVLQADHFALSHIWRIEDQLEQGVRSLCLALGFDDDWGAARLGTKRNASRPTDETFYTEELARIVHRINAPDFDRFGYDPDSWRGL